MKTRFYMLLALPALLLGSCVQNEGPATPAPSSALRVTAGVAGVVATPTRASDNQWADGDFIGVTTIAKASGNAIGTDQVNRKYVLSSISDDKLTADFSPFDDANALYFDDNSEWTFSAYYPYQTEDKIEIFTGSQKGAMSIYNDIMAATGVKAALTAGSSTSPTVSFTGEHAFHHLMSKVEIRLKVSGGLTLADLDNYTCGLSGLVHSGFYTSPTPANPEGLLELDASESASNLELTELGAAAEGSDYRSFGEMFFLPQECEQADFTAARINSGTTEQRLVCVVSNDGTEAGKLKFEAGKSYVIEITLNETKAVLESCKIQDWTTTRFVGDLNDSNMTAGAADIDYSQTRIGDIMFEDGTTQTVDAYKANSDAIKAAHGSPIGIVSVLYGQYNPYLKPGVLNALKAKGITPHGQILSCKGTTSSWTSSNTVKCEGDFRKNPAAYWQSHDGMAFLDLPVGTTGSTVKQFADAETPSGFEAFRWCRKTLDAMYTFKTDGSRWIDSQTTGWYLPSYSELADMVESWAYTAGMEDTETLLDKMRNSQYFYADKMYFDISKINDFLNAILSAIGSDGDSFGYGNYWTTTEFYWENGANSVGFFDTYLILQAFSKGNQHNVRAILTF